MRIVIPGGSGQVGSFLARHFHAKGDEVVVLSRSAQSTPWTTLLWDARTRGDWFAAIDGADIVINLAGRNVNCRYNAANRRAIMASRVDSTHIVGEAIHAAKAPPRIWLQSSAATIYAHTYDHPNDEATGVIGGKEPHAGELALQHRGGPGVGTGACGIGYTAYAEGGAAVVDNSESGSRRDFRCAAWLDAAGPWWCIGRWTAIHFMGARCRFHSRVGVDHRA